jgi:hypothetical protein
MLAVCTGDTGLVGLTRVLEGVGLGRGVLWVGVGEGRAVGDVQAAGKKRGGSGGAASSSPPSSKAWVGAEGAGIDRISSQGMATGVERARTVILTVKQDLVDFLLPVFDEMPARTQSLNFQNFPLWVLIILDKVPRHIFVTVKGGVLQKFIFQI